MYEDCIDEYVATHDPTDKVFVYYDYTREVPYDPSSRTTKKPRKRAKKKKARSSPVDDGTGAQLASADTAHQS